MQKYFNIFLEFDHMVFDSIIKSTLKNRKKGYACIVDGNVLANSVKNPYYREIINGAIVNSCDGSSIAMLAGFIHHKHFNTYTGPEIFSKYANDEQFTQYFLGNTKENLNKLRSNFGEIDCNRFKFESLPFRNVEDFDYKTIARNINEFSPDIIWVSLGAPKQEIFISKLYPLINKGILFAIGAAFNLFLENETKKRKSNFFKKMHLLWFLRIIQEPSKSGSRTLNYLISLPKIVWDELYRTRICRKFDYKN